MSAAALKMDSNLTGMWVSFFTAAGIPSDVSATYALTFTENRIQNDMLLDLNKEYLRDMGISRMGDVIAILRHAKQVHENTARDRVLSTAVSTTAKVPVAAITGRATVSQSSSPAIRILEHYTRNPHVQESTSPTSQLKRKSLETDNDDIGLKKSRLIRFAAAKQNPVVKEGPSKTVFARLGNSEPAKVSAITTKSSGKPIYARLGSKADHQEDDQSIPMDKDALKYEGILKGLPEIPKKFFTVTTTKNNVRKIAMGTMRADETPVSVKTKLAVGKAKSVKFSNHVQYKEIETVRNTKQKAAVLKPLVIPVQKFTQVFNKPERRLSMPEPVNNGVKARLGDKNTNNLTITKNTNNLNITKNTNNLNITKNVFNRLGV